MGESQQAVWVMTSFLAAMIIIFVTARIVGQERKALWFKKREKSNFFTKRGFLGDTWNFGTPRSWQGFAVGIVMFTVIGVSSYLMTFMFVS